MSKSKPLVTIGIPTFERYQHLEKTLLCAINQDYIKLEIIIADNTQNSTLPSKIANIIKSDNRIHYFRHIHNIGLNANDAFIRDKAKGHYLCIFHDDDEYPLNYISSLIEYFAIDPSIVLVVPKCERRLNGKHWYTYYPYRNIGVKLSDKLMDLINWAYFEPSAFEHCYYGLMKVSALPKYFVFGRFRSIVIMVYILSASGSTFSVKNTMMIKNTTNEDIEKHKLAKYVKRDFILRILGSRLEHRLNIFFRLLYWTWGLGSISNGLKARLTASILFNLFRLGRNYKHKLKIP